jgi:hypothetical protein
MPEEFWQEVADFLGIDVSQVECPLNEEDYFDATGEYASFPCTEDTYFCICVDYTKAKLNL